MIRPHVHYWQTREGPSRPANPFYTNSARSEPQSSPDHQAHVKRRAHNEGSRHGSGGEYHPVARGHGQYTSAIHRLSASGMRAIAALAALRESERDENLRVMDSGSCHQLPPCLIPLASSSAFALD